MTFFDQLSIRNQARLLAKEAVGDLAVVNKIKGHIVVLMSDKARLEMGPAAWAERVGPEIRKAIPGWEVIKAVGGLMILELKYKKEGGP